MSAIIPLSGTFSHHDPHPVPLFRCSLCGEKYSALKDAMIHTSREHNMRTDKAVSSLEVIEEARQEIQMTVTRCFPRFFTQ